MRATLEKGFDKGIRSSWPTVRLTSREGGEGGRTRPTSKDGDGGEEERRRIESYLFIRTVYFYQASIAAYYYT